MTNEDIAFDEALAIIKDTLTCVVKSEVVALENSCGRIASADIKASLDVPRHANSAVDGYGFRAHDLAEGNNSLKVVGSSKAGHSYKGSLAKGQALRVFTGAIIDTDQIDTIVMEESVEVAGDKILIVAGTIKAGSNLRRCGDDVKKGDMLIKKGTVITAVHVGLLAAQGIYEVSVFSPLKVGLLSSGDELHDAPAILPDGAIYDSNRPMLKHMLQIRGYQVADYGIIADDEAALLSVLQSAKCDVVLASGGMSLGDEDHLHSILSNIGELCFWRIRCKPGRPSGLGFVARPDAPPLPIIGLPGNPVAAFTIYALLGRVALACLSGESYSGPKRFAVQLGETFNKKAGRREFARATLKQNDAGRFLAYRCGKAGAGVLSSVALADGFLDFPESQGRSEEGDEVAFIPMPYLAV